MELVVITQEIYESTKRLKKAGYELYELAKEKAVAERGCNMRGIREGDRFGRWTVLKKDEKKAKKYYWCLCDCGEKRSVYYLSLINSISKSCGCYGREAVSNNKRKHGMSKEKIYYVYKSMRNRCKNERVKNYHNYGGRGISVCGEWDSSFEKLYEWHKKGVMTDWINAGHEIPHRYMVNGERHTLSEWSKITGVNLNTLRTRRDKGLRGVDLIKKVDKKCKNIKKK